MKQVDSIVVYKNYFTPKQFPNDSMNLFQKVDLNAFNTPDFEQKCKLRPIYGKLRDFLIKEYDDSENYFYKNKDGADYNFMDRDPLLHLQDYRIFACGIVYQNGDVKSYLVLRQALNTIDKIPANYFLLFNCYKGLLSSVALIGGGSSKKSIFSANFIRHYTFSIDKRLITSVLSYKYFDTNMELGDKILYKLGLSDGEITDLDYSNLYIDDIGFVRFTRTNKDDENIISKYIQK